MIGRGLCVAALLVTSAASQEVSAKLDNLITREMAANRIEAMSVALVDHDRVVWSKDFNTPAGTVYRVGSVSKLFTDLAIMQLVESGQLNLDAPIQTYLPEFHPRNPFNRPITLRELMSHRAGLVREPPIGNYFDSTGPSLRDTVMSLNETELVYAPGDRTKYSNAGIAVAGYVLEHLRNQPFASYVSAQILRPLGMTSSTFTHAVSNGYMWTWDGRTFPAPTFELGMLPAGSLYSTTADLARFAMALFHGGSPLVSRETLEQMWQPQYGSAYGLGFRIDRMNGHRLVGHGGAIYGFATELEALPDDGLAAIAIANKDGANAVTTHIANQALRWMLGARAGASLETAEAVSLPQSKPEDPARPKPAPMPATWRPLIGEYGWDYNTLYIHERDGKLSSLIEWFFLDPLSEVAKDMFHFPGSGLYAGEKAAFMRDPNGRVSAVVIGGVSFPRRPDPAEPGQTFRIQLTRPIEELRREALAASPPIQSPNLRQPDLVELPFKLDIRYATTNNFMSAPLYTQARAFLQRPAAEAVSRAQEELKKMGFGLLIHDAYRPWFVTKMFWDGTPPDKHNFVANPATGSRHNRGCAVDLTLYDLQTGAPIEMTGGYDEMSTRSYPNYQGGSDLQRWHRDLLRRAMERQGFQVYEWEWWHFDYKDWQKYPVLNKRFEDL